MMDDTHEAELEQEIDAFCQKLISLAPHNSPHMTRTPGQLVEAETVLELVGKRDWSSNTAGLVRAYFDRKKERAGGTDMTQERDELEKRVKLLESKMDLEQRLEELTCQLIESEMLLKMIMEQDWPKREFSPKWLSRRVRAYFENKEQKK